jgi:RHS repeat-associated protein
VYADQINTPRVITRASDQAIVWRWDQAEAFGAAAPMDNPSGLGAFRFDQRFPGQVFDAETGNHDNWHRTYQAGVGRYASYDPIGLKGGINPFAYVGGNPVSHIDPLGLCKPGPKMKKCLDDLFGQDTSNVDVVVDPPMVARHLGPDVQGATTRPNTIYISMSCDEFWDGPPWFILHEYYHVIQQWGREGMTIPGYLFNFRRREAEAQEFAISNQEKFKKCLACKKE